MERDSHEHATDLSQIYKFLKKSNTSQMIPDEANYTTPPNPETLFPYRPYTPETLESGLAVESPTLPHLHANRPPCGHMAAVHDASAGKRGVQNSGEPGQERPEQW